MLSRVKAVLAWQRGANRSEFRPMAHAHLDVMYIHVQYIRCPRYYRFSDHKRVHQPHSDRTTRCNLQCASGLIVSARRNLNTAAVPSVWFRASIFFFKVCADLSSSFFSNRPPSPSAALCVFVALPFLFLLAGPWEMSSHILWGLRQTPTRTGKKSFFKKRKEETAVYVRLVEKRGFQEGLSAWG